MVSRGTDWQDGCVCVSWPCKLFAGIKRDPCSVAVTLNACSVAVLELPRLHRRMLCSSCRRAAHLCLGHFVSFLFARSVSLPHNSSTSSPYLYRRADLLHAFVVCIGLVPHCNLKPGATLLGDLPLAFDVEVDRVLLIKSWINAPAAAVGTVAAAGAVALAPRAAGAVAPGADMLRLRADVSAAVGASLWWWTRGANRGAFSMVAGQTRPTRAFSMVAGRQTPCLTTRPTRATRAARTVRAARAATAARAAASARRSAAGPPAGAAGAAGEAPAATRRGGNTANRRP